MPTETSGVYANSYSFTELFKAAGQLAAAFASREGDRASKANEAWRYERIRAYAGGALERGGFPGNKDHLAYYGEKKGTGMAGEVAMDS